MIQDKCGRRIRFELNWAQIELYDNLWYCNVILKARQLGISTFICILFLDRCLFNGDLAAGIIAHTASDAEQLFRKIKFAYDNLPNELRRLITANTDTTQMLQFSNSSSIRVGTSLRSSTLQYLHISEFGKICSKYPDKAQEIVTGSLNTVAPGQYIFIESTAEGRDGYFYDICKQAQETKDDQRSNIEFKFHFFPWYKEPGYRTGSSPSIPDKLTEYFDHLYRIGITLDDDQKAWYTINAARQGEDIRREYPSTPAESWEVSNEGFYYAEKMTLARAQGRVGFVPYDDSLLVHTAWDLGYNDSTAIWFFQVYNKEIRIIEYIEGSGSLAKYLGEVKSRKYIYDKHLAPHDVGVTEYNTGTNRQKFAADMGIIFIKVPRTKDKINDINLTRNLLDRCWIDEKKCANGIKCLDNYKKEWDDRHGCWRATPLHNWASHGADAFRTLSTGLHYITGQPTNYDMQKQAQNQAVWSQGKDRHFITTRFG